MIGAIWSCTNEQKEEKTQSEKMTAKEILGNPTYQAISYGGYRDTTRKVQPTLAELKEDMKILSALGIRMLRTYNVQLAHAPNVLKAIRSLKEEDPSFEMYGDWLLEQGRYDEALAQFEVSITRRTNRTKGLRGKLEALKQLDRQEEAREVEKLLGQFS